MSETVKRMWINQPSTLQPLHELHGKRVLAARPEEGSKFVRIWFCDNQPVISQQAPLLSLDEGWPAHV